MTATTSVQINRLRTLVDWCEDNAHALPDDWNAQIHTTGTVGLSWHDKQSADETTARLTEAFGPADDVRTYGFGRQTHAFWKATDGRPELTVFHVTVPETPPAVPSAPARGAGVEGPGEAVSATPLGAPARPVNTAGVAR